MAKFSYVAMDSAGKEKRGEIGATGGADAINKLKNQGFFTTSISQSKEGGETNNESDKNDVIEIQKKLVVLLFCLLIFPVGVALIGLKDGWWDALGVFIMMTAHSIAQGVKE